MTTDQYAAFAEDYEKVKILPYVQHLEMFTFLQAIGDVRGKTILDLACGEGHYARLLRRNGASKVVGVDVSEAMIDVAWRKETADPLGITYHAYDVSRMPQLGSFDLVVAGYLLHYAADEATLSAMCQRIVENLADDAMFIHFGLNPDYRLEDYDDAKFGKYGLKITSVTPTAEGSRVTISSSVLESSSLVAYHLPMATYERVLARAGFTKVEWIPPKVSDEGIKEFGEEFWIDALNNPQTNVMRASR